MRLRIIILLATIFLFSTSFIIWEHSYLASTNKKVHDFSLRNIDNTIISLSQYKNAKGIIIVFTCNHCPFAKLYSSRFNALNKKYTKLGVPLLAINPMDTIMYSDEIFSEMQKRALRDKFNFPYLQDSDQSVGKDFGATHTPQAFVIWREGDSFIIRYSGAIDDNGQHPNKANSFVGKAVDELLSGGAVSDTQIASIGCKINYRNK